MNQPPFPRAPVRPMALSGASCQKQIPCSKSKLLRRVRLTLNGLESGRGAEVNVTFYDFKKIGGVLWPTDFDERVRSPFKLHAHHWNLRGREINRGLNIRDLKLSQWSPNATKPASALIP